LKIHRIEIERYGPLENLSFNIDPKFQCFYGPNESGKTLIIDAILKMSLGKKLRTSLQDSLGRVDEEPLGRITIRAEGKDTQIGKGKHISDVGDIDGLDFRDIFVIRNSDLVILTHDKCFNRVTDKLFGLSSGDIELIEEQLRDRGKLTASLKISTADGEEGPGGQLKAAKKLRTDLEEYLEDATGGNIGGLESDVIRLTAKVEQSEVTREELEQARLLKEYENLKSALAEARRLISEQDKMPEALRNDVRSSIDRFKELDAFRIHHSQMALQFGRLMLVGAVGTSVSAVLTILFLESFLGLVPLAAILVFTLAMVWKWSVERRELSQQETLEWHLKDLARSMGRDANDVYASIAVLEQDLIMAKAVEKELAERIGVIKNALGVRNLPDWKLLEKAQNEVDSKEKIAKTEVHRQFSEEDLESTKEQIAEARTSLESKRSLLTKHKSKLESFLTQLGQLRFETYTGRNLEHSPDSIDTLKDVSEELEEFTERIEKDAEICRSAITIFREITEEEGNRISDLLSKESIAPRVFSEITEGRYTSIEYRPEDQQILAVHKDGTKFRVDQLSRGARDQLYFAIRMALGEKLLKGKAGFFILDDPFLASDLKRTSTQSRIMKGMVDRGWQILYFTARQDLAGALGSTFGTQPIELTPLS